MSSGAGFMLCLGDDAEPRAATASTAIKARRDTKDGGKLLIARDPLRVVSHEPLPPSTVVFRPNIQVTGDGGP
jgi:hypothetical protein